MLGHRCCVGFSLVVMCGLLTVVASLGAEHRLSGAWASVVAVLGSGAQAQKLWHMGLAVPRQVGSSRIRARAPVSCIDRWILYH